MTATDAMYQVIAAQSQLPADVAAQLRDAGFVVIPGPATPGGIERLSEAYDHTVATADAVDVRVASSTRVTDFVNRGPEFDGIYMFPPLLAACCLIIGRPYKLSGTRARTLEPGAPVEALHVDVRKSWPVVPRVLSSFSTGRCGTATQQTARGGGGVQFKATSSRGTLKRQ